MNQPVPRKLRVAVFNRTFSPTGGGAERYSIALVEQLSARHEVHVFAQEIDHQWPGVSYHKVSAPLRKPRWINQLWFATASWWATRSGFDIVHSHENTWHGEVQTVHVLPVKHSLFQGRHGVRRVLRWIKVVTSPRLLAYLGLERARYAPRPGRQVVVTSESLRPIMEAAYPASRPALSVVTPGINMPQLPISASRKTEARAKLGLPAAGTCLLFVGNDYRKKGLEGLLRALAQLPGEVVLAVVGNPAHIAEFRVIADTLKLGARVVFLGALKDVGPAYEAADVLVHPTFEDTFAMVVLEAMAHGLPVVVSGAKYCGIAGLLAQGANALLLDDPRDAGELARVLGDLLGQPALRETLSRGAVAFAERYQWREIALQQEALYFSALAAKGSPP
ncbi:glycosyltransferase family 4 protein [Polaromonas sp. CT11-55]|uniref:glycosyltransferase family 4 protein n=1 Tax=Polaromonas sp. CT11-55 TaxID=3243045 RepID=UPI0039A4561B